MPDAKTQALTNPITELRVTGHLMTLDEGLFCVYNTPGSAPPDAATGLPGVRITPAPGRGSLPGQVGVRGFNDDGWLGGEAGAALVRITGGPAQVLVTIYQAAEGGHDAPRLQVIRLSEPAPAAAAQPAPRQVEARPQPLAASQPQAAPQGIEVGAHIYGRGDVGGRLGEWMGEPGSKRWIEGFGLAPQGIAPSDIEYQAVLGRGWLSPWAEGGQFCGSRGMSLPILGLRVRLKGAAAGTYAAAVSATFVDGSRVGPVTDGEAAEAPSLSPLEAFLVELRPAAAEPAPAKAPAARRGTRAAPPAPEPEPPAPRKRGRAAVAEPEPPPAAPAKRGRAKAAPEPEPAPKPAGRSTAGRSPAGTRRR